MQRFEAAWRSVDIDGILALLASDALLTMPPERMRFQGARAIAAYARNEKTGTHDAYGVMVFAIDGDKIAGITGFPSPALFGRLALPLSMSG